MSGGSRRRGFLSLELGAENREAAVLRASTELFIKGERRPDEATRFEELASHFLPKVSVADRAFVADLLADCEEAPVEILRMLGKDAIEVARPVLFRSQALSHIDLLMIIAATGALHHRVIARRRALHPDIVSALRLMGDREVATILDAAIPEEKARERRLAQALAAGLGVDLPAAAEKTATAAIPPTPPASIVEAPARRLDPFVPADFLAMAPQERLSWMAEMSSRRIAPPPRIGLAELDGTLRAAFHAARIVGHARARRGEALVQGLAEAVRLDPFTVKRMVDDVSGEPLALLLKAIGLETAEARIVLLLANEAIGRSVDAFMRIADIHAGIEGGIAEAFVAGWRGEKIAGAPLHQPMFSTAPGVRPATGTAARPAAQSEQDRARSGNPR
jgi:hypothetical protein